MITKLHESVIFQFGSHVLFQGIGAIVVLGVGSVISPTVGQHAFDIGDKQSLVAIVVGLQTFTHGLQIHRVLDMIVIIRYL